MSASLATSLRDSAANTSGLARGRQLAAAAGIVMAAFLLSRLLGLARQQVFNVEFGTTAQMDAFWAAFRIPDALFQLVAGGALGSAFIPVFAGYLAKRDETQAWLVASTIFNAMLLAIALAAAVGMVFAPLLVSWMVPGYGPEEQRLVTSLTRILLAQPVLLGASSLLAAILNSYQQFLLPALAPSIYNAAIIGAALLLGSRLGVHALAYGVVAGAALQVALQLPSLVWRRVPYRAGLLWRHEGVREILRLLLPRVFALAALQMNFIISTFLASRLVAGSLTGFTNAFQLMLLPQGIFAVAVSTAVFPTFAQQSARSEHEDLAATLSASLRFVLFLTIPASVALVMLRVPLVRTLFQYGAFDQTSLELTTWPLMFFAIGLFGHASVEVTLRAFYALHETLRPVILNCISLAVNAALSFALVGWLAQGGLALAMSVGVIVETWALLWMLRGRLPSFDYGRLGRAAGKHLTASLVMGMILWLALALSGGAGLAGPGRRSLQLVLLMVLGAAAYVAVAGLLRCEEVSLTLRLLRDRWAARPRFGEG